MPSKSVGAFSGKTTPANFQNFPNSKIFWFFAKNLNIGGKRTYLRNNIILYAFYCKFATFYRFWKNHFFFKKIHFFNFKKTQISYVIEEAYDFIRMLRQICYNLVIKRFKLKIVHFAMFCQNRPIGK